MEEILIMRNKGIMSIMAGNKGGVVNTGIWGEDLTTNVEIQTVMGGQQIPTA